MNPIIKSNFEKIFVEYQKLIGEGLLRASILNREGTIINEFLTKELGTIVDVFNEILSKIINLFPIGAFGAGIYETEQRVYLIFETGFNNFFVTTLAKTANIDVVFTYSCLVAEKIDMIFKDIPTFPIIPKFSSQIRIITKYIERKIGVIQKINAKLGEDAFKLVLGGDKEVDKFSVVREFADAIFSEDYKSTIGTSVFKIEQNFRNIGIKVRFVGWDLPVQTQFKRLGKSYMSNAKAGILVFDIANRKSFEYIEKLYEDIIKASPEILLILIGNKSDLKRQVISSEGKNFAEKIGCILYIENSPDIREPVTDGLKLLALQLILKHLVVTDIAEIDSFKMSDNQKKQEKISNKANLLRRQFESDLDQRIKYQDIIKQLTNKKKLEVTEIDGDGKHFLDLDGNKFLRAYSGVEPFVFISYSHIDSKIVYREIEWLCEKGFNVWYDEGLPPSSNWEHEIPDKISKCDAFIVFISKNSVISKNVGREISYAIKYKSGKILLIFIEETNLPKDIEFNLLRIQWIPKHKWSDERYRSELLNSIKILLL